MDWSYFDKFEWADDKYLPDRGEGDTMATQLVTAVTKLVYKWYNDGDVYDNTYHMSGWCNDLSSYANWLYNNIPVTVDILDRIKGCWTDEEYEKILADLVDATHTEEYLAELDGKEKVGSIYECDGPFEFYEGSEEEDSWDTEEEEDEDEVDEVEDEKDTVVEGVSEEQEDSVGKEESDGVSDAEEDPGSVE